MSVSLLTLAAVGTLGLLWSIVGGYAVPGSAPAMKPHFVVSLVSTLILAMAHSFIMFFLIATGVEMKNMEKEKGWGDSFRRRTVAMKGKVFPVMTLALMLVIANFILGAGAHTRAIRPSVPTRKRVGTAISSRSAASGYGSSSSRTGTSRPRSRTSPRAVSTSS